MNRKVLVAALLVVSSALWLAAPEITLARPQCSFHIHECGTLEWSVEGCLNFRSDLDSTLIASGIDPELGYLPPAHVFVQGVACGCATFCDSRVCLGLYGPYTIGPCVPVATRACTWGRIKILYR